MGRLFNGGRSDAIAHLLSLTDDHRTMTQDIQTTSRALKLRQLISLARDRARACDRYIRPRAGDAEVSKRRHNLLKFHMNAVGRLAEYFLL